MLTIVQGCRTRTIKKNCATEIITKHTLAIALCIVAGTSTILGQHCRENND